MKLWKIIHENDRWFWRSIPVPVDCESRQDILDLLGLGDLEGSGTLFVYPSGFCRDGKREYDIFVWAGIPYNSRIVMHYVFTY